MDGVVIRGQGVIHNPNCGHVAGNNWLRKPREGDRLGGCCHRLTAAPVEPKDIEAIVAAHVTAALNAAAEKVEEWRDMHRRLADLVSDDASSAVRAAADRSRVRQLSYARAASIVRAATP